MLRTNLIEKLLPHKRKCPGCGRLHRLQRSMRNKNIICRYCGDEITVEDHLESLTLGDSRLIVSGMFFCMLLVGIFAGISQLPSLGMDGGESFKIGVLVPNTVFENRSLIDAAVLAAAEINTGGGIHGKEIEVLSGFTRGDPAIAAAEARKMADEGVVAIIGPMLSAEAEHVAANVTVPLKILNFSPGLRGVSDASLDSSMGVEGALRVLNSHLWRTVHWSRDEAMATADYIFNDQGKKTVGVIYRDCPYGRGLAGAFREEFTKRGGRVLNFIGFPELPDYTAHDFTPAIKAALAGSPEVIYTVCYVNDGIRISRLLPFVPSSKVQRLHLWSSTLYHDSFLRSASSGIREFSYVISGVSKEKDRDLGDFFHGYTTLFGLAEHPSVFAPNSYDAVYLSVLAAAAGEAANDPAIEKFSSDSATEKSPEDPRLYRYMRQVASSGRRVRLNQFTKGMALMEKGIDIDYHGASGRINFDRGAPEGKRTYRIWKIESNKFVEMAAKSY